MKGVGKQSCWCSSLGTCLARSAAGTAQPGSFVLSTAEGMLQHCSSAAVSFSRSPTLPLRAGTVPLQCSSCHRGGHRNRHTNPHWPRDRNIQAGDARAAPKEQHKGTLGVSLGDSRTAELASDCTNSKSRAVYQELG